MERQRAFKSFNNCKIYRITLPNGEFYINGTTVNKLCRLKPNFKDALRDYDKKFRVQKLFMVMKENNYNFDRIDLELIEEFDCESQQELDDKKNEYIKNEKPTLNEYVYTKNKFKNQNVRNDIIKEILENEETNDSINEESKIDIISKLDEMNATLNRIEGLVKNLKNEDNDWKRPVDKEKYFCLYCEIEVKYKNCNHKGTKKHLNSEKKKKSENM